MSANHVAVRMSRQPDVNIAVIAPYRATVPGPFELCIKNAFVADANGKPVSVVKEGEVFNICVDVYYSEMIGDLQPQFIFDVTVIDLSSCGVVKSYCCSVQGQLKCDTTHARFCCQFQCVQKGVFTFAATFSLAQSDLFDYVGFKQCFACSPACLHDEVKGDKLTITAPATLN
ncbi:hypothetical protein L0337_11375 [candidate division KSB1 bacterium]|nr:hypothetical protein [candidate division KSB1 bacterium]